MPIGACMVAEAVKRSGYKVSLLDLMFIDDVAGAVKSEIRNFKPDIIGISVRNIDNNDMVEPILFVRELRPLIEIIRNVTDSPVILGGAALSVMPEAILEETGVSIGVIGDGEFIFPELLKRFEKGEDFNDVAGVVIREKGSIFKSALTSNSYYDCCFVPDYPHWLDVKKYQSQLSTVPVQTKIGCQFKCIYCTYRKIEGNSYLCYNPESVADAIVRLASTGLRDIEFVDSIFNAPYEHAMAVCESLSKLDHNARLQSLELNPIYLTDELVSVMECAGFVGIGITVESASDQVLSSLKKGFTSREVHRASEVVKRHRLPCSWIFLLGGPGETKNTVKETLSFIEKHVRPNDVAFINIGIRVYPGTELESIARKEGVIKVLPKDMLEPVFYVSSEIDALWLTEEIKKIMSYRMNVISSGSIGLSFLPRIHRIGHFLGIRPPLWKYTRFIRRGLRLMGMDV
jgi:radical SAM superfamily enzyme YgiQ (UPF0313 family)